MQGDRDQRGGTPGAGSMLIGYGDRCVDALLASGLGRCIQDLAAPAACP